MPRIHTISLPYSVLFHKELWGAICSLSDFELLLSSFVSFFFQKKFPKVMRQGLEEMLQFDKKPDERMRVYTYENAVKRCYTLLFYCLTITLNVDSSKNIVYAAAV